MTRVAHAMLVAEVVRLRAGALRDRPSARILTNSATENAKHARSDSFAPGARGNEAHDVRFVTPAATAVTQAT